MAQPTVAHATLVHPIGLTQADLMAETPSTRRADPQPDPASESIIRSKVQAPVVRDSTLARGRLLRWLDEHVQERVRVIAAEAGYGKTTLLADWARRVDRPVRWLKLDPTDSEWTTFISYLVAAFQEGDPDFGQATQRLLAHVATLGTTMDQVTSQFLGEFSAAQMGPCVLIVDDLQHVQGSADVQRILERLIERAPDVLTFILSGRNKPDLRLGRLTAQGNVIGLGTEDLRFTRQETGELFAVGYRMPLDGDLVSVVDTRTEGWGASLQLLYSSICSQRPAEVREFIHGLAGSQEPLYDFLAEEVLERQSPLMQRVLLHAAILDRILPPLVVAALGATDDPPGADAVIDALDAADELGLMSRNAQRSSSRRFHPLLREFLSSHLKVTTPTAVLQLMHLRVAQAAEPIHWPTSAHHYIEADEGQEAMRVIGDASFNALGTGAWGPALDLVARIPHIEPSASVQVIKARSLVAQGAAAAAIALLESVPHPTLLGGRDRGLVRLALANALASAGRTSEVRPVLAELVSDDDVPDLITSIGRAWYQLDMSASIPETLASMRGLAIETSAHGLHLYSAIAHHNSASLLLATADYREALREAESALEMWTMALDDDGNAASTRVAMAHIYFELGDYDKVVDELATAQRSRLLQPDVFGDSASLLAWMGRGLEAAAALAHGWSILPERSHPSIVRDGLQIAQAVLHLAHGEANLALKVTEAAAQGNMDPNYTGMLIWCRGAAAAITLDEHSATLALQDATEEIERRGITRWHQPIRVVKDALNPNPRALEALFVSGLGVSDPVLLVTADVIGMHIDRLTNIPDRLDRLVRRWPERWRPILRRSLGQGAVDGGSISAELLSQIGEDADVDVLQRWERRKKKSTKDPRPSLALARRVSPTLRIQDLGRASIMVASRQVMIAGVRRRAASLLLFLASRPRQTATREQVFEALWPDLESSQAANSLHQTLYFLRRELVAKPNEARPIVEYVPVESELVYLDSDLVQVESVSFLRMAREIVGRNPGAASAMGLLTSYRGTFAPEFEYDEWAIQWRDHVHSAFLDLSEQAARARLPDNAPEAAAILRNALEVDPGAMELRPLMAAALHLSGSQAAARQLHDRYAEEHLKELGELPQPLAELLAETLGRTGSRSKSEPPQGGQRGRR